MKTICLSCEDAIAEKIIRGNKPGEGEKTQEYLAVLEDNLEVGKYFLVTRDKDQQIVLLRNQGLAQLAENDNSNLVESKSATKMFSIKNSEYETGLNVEALKREIIDCNKKRVVQIAKILISNESETIRKLEINKERLISFWTWYNDKECEGEIKSENFDAKILAEIEPYYRALIYRARLIELKECLEEAISKSNLVNVDIDDAVRRIDYLISKDYLLSVHQARLERVSNKRLSIASYEDTGEIVLFDSIYGEFKINFSFFWSMVRNILSLVYIPIVLILLTDYKEKKISLYCSLALLYFVVLFFADEKQVKKFKEYKEETGKKVSYALLQSFGMHLTSFFIVFSIFLVMKLEETHGFLLLLLVALPISYVLAWIILGFLQSVFLTKAWLKGISFVKPQIENITEIIKKLIISSLYIAGCMAFGLIAFKYKSLSVIIIMVIPFLVLLFASIQRIRLIWNKHK